jgi:hypothetical protein
MLKKPLYVIDLDRTLVDTDKIVEMLAISLNHQGYDGSALIDKIEKARLSEKDINAREAIDSLGKDAWESVWEDFCNEAKKKTLVFDDAQLFLKSLKAAKVPHIILTFGISKAWQDLKLMATGLDGVPAIVTSSREKSKIINSWKGDDGVYVPPGFAELSASSVVLVDDRPNAFSNITGNDLKGYLLDRLGELGSFKPPAKVRIISSLSEVEI